MSAQKMVEFSKAQDVFDGPMQAFAMQTLCWFHSETTDDARVSFGYLARMTRRHRRYVMRVMEQLELEKEACVNLGPDPDISEGRGRNRWAITLDRAVAKARAASTVVIPAPPEKERNADVEAVENDLRFLSGGTGITTLVIPAPPPGDPSATTLVAQGSPQSAPVIKNSDLVLRSTAADADASAAAPPLEFNLIGEVPASSRTAKAQKLARQALLVQLRERIKRHARWILEHPAEAHEFNAGAAIATLSDLLHATKVRCALKRIPGYGEGDVLENVCRSEWHLFAARRSAFGLSDRPRDRRSNPYETTRGQRRRR